MNREVAGFQILDRCECCGVLIDQGDKCIVIVKWPNGGTDTLCVDCYQITTRSAVAWLSYVGDLPSESSEERQERGRKASNRQRRLTLLEYADI